MPKLEDWGIISEGTDAGFPSELLIKMLYGKVEGHTRFEDGKYVRTSRILAIDFDNNIAQTLNTQYELGEMNERFKQILEENNLKLIGTWKSSKE